MPTTEPSVRPNKLDSSLQALSHKILRNMGLLRASDSVLFGLGDAHYPEKLGSSPDTSLNFSCGIVDTPIAVGIVEALRQRGNRISFSPTKESAATLYFSFSSVDPGLHHPAVFCIVDQSLGD